MKIEGSRGKLAKIRQSVLCVAAGLSLVLSVPALAAPASNVKPTVTAADYHSVVQAVDGSVWHWGGVADTVNGKYTLRDNKPQLMPNLTNVADVQSYRNDQLILKKDGTVWQGGPTLKVISEKAYETVTEYNKPKQVEGLRNIVKIAAGDVFSAIDKDGAVWVWHPLVNYNGVHKLENIADAQDISWNGDADVQILRQDGTVWKWTAYGEDITFVQADKQYKDQKFDIINQYAVRNVKVTTNYNALKIDDLTQIVALSHGNGRQNFAIAKDGAVWGWGARTLKATWDCPLLPKR